MSMYRPLPDYLRIDDSDIEGRGLFTSKALPGGVYLGITHIIDDRFPDNLIRTPLGGFINHSESPNCEIEITGDLHTQGGGRYHLRTKFDITANSELTVCYTLTNPKFKLKPTKENTESTVSGR